MSNRRATLRSDIGRAPCDRRCWRPYESGLWKSRTAYRLPTNPSPYRNKRKSFDGCCSTRFPPLVFLHFVLRASTSMSFTVTLWKPIPSFACLSWCASRAIQRQCLLPEQQDSYLKDQRDLTAAACCAFQQRCRLPFRRLSSIPFPSTETPSGAELSQHLKAYITK
jgi:hypothetical protein